MIELFLVQKKKKNARKHRLLNILRVKSINDILYLVAADRLNLDVLEIFFIRFIKSTII